MAIGRISWTQHTGIGAKAAALKHLTAPPPQTLNLLMPTGSDGLIETPAPNWRSISIAVASARKSEALSSRSRFRILLTHDARA